MCQISFKGVHLDQPDLTQLQPGQLATPQQTAKVLKAVAAEFSSYGLQCIRRLLRISFDTVGKMSVRENIKFLHVFDVDTYLRIYVENQEAQTHPALNHLFWFRHFLRGVLHSGD
jgi:hypothetical protein